MANEDLEDFFKTDLTQPDSTIQLRARGLLHMEREFIAHHIKEDDSGLEHLIASMQPKKYSTPAGLDYEELGDLSDPGRRDCLQAWNILE